MRDATGTIFDSSCIGMHDCNSSSKRRANNGPTRVRGGGTEGALEAGRLPSGLFPKLDFVVKAIAVDC